MLKWERLSLHPTVLPKGDLVLRIRRFLKSYLGISSGINSFLNQPYSIQITPKVPHFLEIVEYCEILRLSRWVGRGRLDWTFYNSEEQRTDEWAGDLLQIIWDKTVTSHWPTHDWN